MSLFDLVVPCKKVTVTQAIEKEPAKVLDVYGLTTEDFIRLADEHAKILAAIFFHNAKENKEASDNSKVIMLQFPAFGASCIALGCKQPEAAEHIRNLPLMTQVELLSTVLSLTFPEGLKKSLEKLAPTIALLLKK